MYVTFAAGYTTKHLVLPNTVLHPERNSRISLQISNAPSAALIKTASRKKRNEYYKCGGITEKSRRFSANENKDKLEFERKDFFQKSPDKQKLIKLFYERTFLWNSYY